MNNSLRVDEYVDVRTSLTASFVLRTGLQQCSLFGGAMCPQDRLGVNDRDLALLTMDLGHTAHQARSL